jgi:hypothetical protein
MRIPDWYGVHCLYWRYIRSVWESFHILSLGDTHSGFSTGISLPISAFSIHHARCITPLDAQYSKFVSHTFILLLPHLFCRSFLLLVVTSAMTSALFGLMFRVQSLFPDQTSTLLSPFHLISHTERAARHCDYGWSAKAYCYSAHRF